MPADWDVAVSFEHKLAKPRGKKRIGQQLVYVHSLQRIVNRLRLPAHALAAVRGLFFQRCDAGCFAVFQALGVDWRERRLLLLLGGDLEVLHAREGDDVVIAGVAAGGRGGWASVDGDEVEGRAGGEEGAFEGLGGGRCGC